MDKKVIRSYFIINPILSTAVTSMLTYFIIVLFTFLYKKLPWLASLFDLEYYFEGFSFNENIWLFSGKLLIYFATVFLLFNIFVSIRDYVKSPKVFNTNIKFFKDKWKNSLYDVLFFGVLHLSLILGMIFYLVITIFFNWGLFELLTFASESIGSSMFVFRDIMRFFSILFITVPMIFIAIILPISYLNQSLDLNIWKRDLSISS